MAGIAEIVLVVVLVVALGYGLSRFQPDPPNPARPRGGFLAGNFWANTGWGGAGTMLLAPVLGYFEGLFVGVVMLVVGATLVVVASRA